jgi:hypothetical protein
LDAGTNDLPVDAIRQAREYRDDIIPRLIQVLHDAAARAADDDPPEGMASFFALHLLTEFHAKEALPAIISAISLPDELPFELFGDAITETLFRVLAELAADDLQIIGDTCWKMDGELGRSPAVDWRGRFTF